MPSVNFILRPSTKLGRHPGSLSLRVIHNRKIKIKAISCRLFPEEWDAVEQCIIYPDNAGRVRELEGIEDKITSCKVAIHRIVASLEKQGSYTVEDIINKYQHNKDNGKLLGWVDTLARELIQNNQLRLARAYKTVARGLVKYNKGENMLLIHINACLIKGFEKELMQKGKSPNTISYYMRNLRSIYNKAIAAKRIPSRQGNPFVGVNTKVKATQKRALTAEEMTKLYEIDFDKKKAEHPVNSSEREYVNKLHYAWKLFMFCFFAQGMCFIDMANLKKENIHHGKCTYYRSKTGKQVELVVNEGMQQIIDSFASEVKDSPFLFPILKDESTPADKQRQYETALRTQNRRLKVLAGMAKISNRISTHVARHSWATIVRSGGIPTGVISEMMGHTTERMTHNYFAPFPTSYSEKAYTVVSSALSGKMSQPRI